MISPGSGYPGQYVNAGGAPPPAAFTAFGDLQTLFAAYCHDSLSWDVPPPIYDLTTILVGDRATVMAGSGGNEDDINTALAYYLTGIYG